MVIAQAEPPRHLACWDQTTYHEIWKSLYGRDTSLVEQGKKRDPSTINIESVSHEVKATELTKDAVF